MGIMLRIYDSGMSISVDKRRGLVRVGGREQAIMPFKASRRGRPRKTGAGSTEAVSAKTSNEGEPMNHCASDRSAPARPQFDGTQSVHVERHERVEAGRAAQEADHVR
jgi:hypothetical protein